MSTWHDHEPLEEAVWFFLQSAFPLDGEIASTSYLAITVGNPDWAATVDRSFSNLFAFKTKMLEEKTIFFINEKTIHTLP